MTASREVRPDRNIRALFVKDLDVLNVIYRCMRILGFNAVIDDFPFSVVYLMSKIRKMKVVHNNRAFTYPEGTKRNEWEGVKILGYYADFIDVEEYAMTLDHIFTDIVNVLKNNKCIKLNDALNAVELH